MQNISQNPNFGNILTLQNLNAREGNLPFSNSQLLRQTLPEQTQKNYSSSNNR